jgi:hypothetical protein
MAEHKESHGHESNLLWSAGKFLKDSIKKILSNRQLRMGGLLAAPAILTLAGIPITPMMASFYAGTVTGMAANSGSSGGSNKESADAHH